MRRLRRPALAAGALALLAGAALFAVGRAAGIGPLAAGAPASWVYVAESLNDPDSQLRQSLPWASQIEAVDLASGEHHVFAVSESSVLDVALSPDRRTLYAGSHDGRVLLLDALRGTTLGTLRSSVRGDVRFVTPLPDGRRVAALTAYGPYAVLVVFDVNERAEIGTLELGRRALGRPIYSGSLLIPVRSDGPADSILDIAVDRLVVEREIAVGAPQTSAFGTGQPSIDAVRAGTLVDLSPFWLRVAVLEDESVARAVDLATLYGGPAYRAPTFGLEGDVVLSPDGSVIHACLWRFGRAQRYRMATSDLAPTVVDRQDCGRFGRTPAGELVLAAATRPELQLLDQSSGAVRRRLPLAGYEVALAD